MNTNDFSATVEYPDDLLKSVFEHQHELAEKYIPIEKGNGLCQYDQIPGDIDDAKCQARIKDMTWRMTEEVAEAIEAFSNKERDHFQEELADAMHFLVEKYLICGFNPAFSLEWYFLNSCQNQSMETTLNALGITGTILISTGILTVSAGLTCNCLKNKPWKQSQMLTDKNKFFSLLNDELQAFIDLCYLAGYEPKSLYDMYIRKNQVNQFRQRSNY